MQGCTSCNDGNRPGSVCEQFCPQAWEASLPHSESPFHGVPGLDMTSVVPVREENMQDIVMSHLIAATCQLQTLGV